MSDFATADYERWGGPVQRWAEVDDFCSAPSLLDGVHVITATPGPPIELFIHRVTGEDVNTALPVFFTGAVDKRSEKTGPFFSGLALSEQGGFGFISLADPSLGLNSSLGLAWYAGNQHQDVQGQIARILDKISSQYGRELILIGGSGGGYAALYFGYLLGEKCSALVWNPQTDIFKYNPTATKAYFEAAYGPGIVNALKSPSWEASAKQYLAEYPITFDLLDLGRTEKGPKRLLILQNATDWHVPHHLAPFMSNAGFNHSGRGVYQKGSGQLSVLANFGDDHTPLPAQAVLAAVRTLMDTGADVETVLDHIRVCLPSDSTPVSTLPRDLRSLTARIAEELNLQVRSARQGLRVEVAHGAMPVNYGGARYSLFFRAGGEAPIVGAAQASPIFEVSMESGEFDEVGVVVRDGFLNEIVVLRAPLNSQRL